MASGSVHISISSDPAAALAERFVDLVASLEETHVAVSGGSTPRELFRILADSYGREIQWERVHVYQVDERCVPPDHADSNWRMLEESLLAKVPAAHAYRMEAEKAEAAPCYEALLQSRLGAALPALDLVLLGMGDDGHTASLFPGTQALDEKEHLVVRNVVPQIKAERITMTYPLIQSAKQRWFLVKGGSKAKAFARVQAGELPAGKLRECEWFMDHAAARAKL